MEGIALAYIRQYKGRWRAEVQKHGHRATHMADTKREAQAWALRKEDELDALAASGGKTLQAAVAHYVSTVSSTKANPEWERRRLDAIMEYFGPKAALSKIDSAMIGKWRDWRLTGEQEGKPAAKPVTGSTVQRESNLLRNLFSLAVDEWRWIARNPYKGVRLPKENPPRTAIWNWKLIRRVLRAPRIGKTAEMQRAFRVSLHTGLRLQEVLTGRYDPRRRVVVLPKSKGVDVVVSVPVTRRAARILTTTPFVVDPNEGSTLFSELCGELLIEGLTFHDARASALTWLSRRMDVMTLARISRHKDLRILMNTYYRETADQIAARI